MTEQKMIKNSKVKARIFSFKKPQTIEESKALVHKLTIFIMICIYPAIRMANTGSYEAWGAVVLYGTLIIFLVHYLSRTLAIIFMLLLLLNLLNDIQLLYAWNLSAADPEHQLIINIISIVLGLLYYPFVFFIIWRTLQGTFAYHQIIGSKVQYKNVIKKTLLSILYSVSAVFILASVHAIAFLDDFNEEKYAVLVSLVYLFTFLCVFALAFRGWLPFTKNKPICISSKESTPQDTIKDISS